MLNRLTAILLITCLVSVNCSRFFVFAGFEINKGYIAATLCENRAKPELHCNGKCYLMKKLKQVEQKENNQERQSQKNLFQEAFYTSSYAIKFHSQLLFTIPVPNNRISLPAIHGSLFRPPQIG
jgi:hypothetical protein